MKTRAFISVLFISLGLGAEAQVCSRLSPEIQTFKKQRSWQAVEISDPEVPGTIKGYVNTENQFYFGEMTRRGTYRARLKVNSKNPDFKDFFKYCANWRAKGGYLNLMRRSASKNTYTMDLTYLPAIKGFKNDPLKDQQLRESYMNFDLRLNPDSISLSEEVFSEEYHAQVYRMIQGQLESQKEYGKISLDLTGYDDFVCDLIQGNAGLVIRRADSSKAALIEQEIQISPSDVETLYNSLSSSPKKISQKEELLFRAGYVAKGLEAERKIGALSEDVLFRVASKFFAKDFSGLLSLNQEELSCVSDQLQKYGYRHIQHLFNISLKFDPLAEIQQESEKSND